MADRDLSGRTLGEFVLREQIGAGGYGAVYRSDQPLLKRSVVVKVLHERQWRSPIAQERFLREAQLASRLARRVAEEARADAARSLRAVLRGRGRRRPHRARARHHPSRPQAVEHDGHRARRPTGVAPPLLVDLEHYRVVTQLEGHRGRVFSVRWVAGHQILTAGGDGTARLWDGITGQLLHTYEGSSRYVADAILASDNLVIAGGGDGILRFWDLTSERLLWVLPAHKSALISVHVQGSDIITQGIMGEVTRWQLPARDQVIRACESEKRCSTVLR